MEYISKSRLLGKDGLVTFKKETELKKAVIQYINVNRRTMMSNRYEVGALILRVVLGIVFLAHGAAKFQGGIENIAGWFDSIGLPGGLAYIVATIELVGGIALILGVGTRVVSALIGLIMVGAIFKVNFAIGFLDGYAYDFVLLFVAIYLVLNGSKLLALGQFFYKGQETKNSVATSA